MGLFDRLFRRKSSVQVGTQFAVVPGMAYLQNNQHGVHDTLIAYETTPWFRAIIERISFVAASVTWRTLAVRGARGESKFVKHLALQHGEDLEVRARLKAALEGDDRLVDVVDHPLLELLMNPNPILSGIDTMMLTYATWLVAGEIGWLIKREPERVGVPQSLWVIPPHWIRKRPSSDYDWYQVQVGRHYYEFSPEEFILFRNPSLSNPYGVGSGMGIALADELETDEYISKFQKSWFYSRGRPDLVVSMSGGGVNTLQAMKERFDNTYRDATSGARSMWVRGSDVKVTELKQKMVDLDLTQQRSWVKDLAREVYGVPPEIMGDVKDSNRATISAAYTLLSKVVVLPLLVRVRSHLQNKIVPMYDDRLVLDFWDPTPEDKEAKLEALKVAPWAATRGEIRRMQGLPDRGKGDDVHVMPTGLVLTPGIEKHLVEATLKGLATQKQPKQLVAKAIDAGDAERLVRAVQPERLRNELSPEISKTVEEWGQSTLDGLGLEVSFDMLNPLVVDHLQEFATERIAQINETSQTLLRNILIESVQQGDSADVVARRITKLFDGFDKVRSATIARSEVTRAANFGTWAGHRESGVIDRRRWLSTPDARLRDEHAALDGQEVGIDEVFTASSGETAMYPGDFGVGALDINCRCTTVAVVINPRASDVEVYKAFIDQTDNDEDRVQAATRRAFDQQLKDVLNTLERL